MPRVTRNRILLKKKSVTLSPRAIFSS